MKTNTIKKSLFTAGKLAGVVGAALIYSQFAQAATATVEAVITSGGTETANVPVSQFGDWPYLRVTSVTNDDASFHNTYCVTDAYKNAGCFLDTTRGGLQPGVTIHEQDHRTRSGGTKEFSFNQSTMCVTGKVTVVSNINGGGLYKGGYEFHLKCPQTVSWTNSQTKTITVDSKNGYANVGTYTGPVGSAIGLPGTAVVDNNLFKVEIKNPVPADATITAGMFLTSPANGQKGPNIFALYEPTNIATPPVKALSSLAITNQGGGSAIADINNNGIDDIVFVSYQDVVNSDGRNEFTYQIGWDIDTEGNPKSWTSSKHVDGTGWEGNGAAVALFKPTTAGTATKAIFLNHDQGSQAVNDFRVRVGMIDGNGNFHESTNFSIPSFGANIYGMGAELYDIDNNGLPEIIISGNSTSNSTHGYKIGWNLQDNGTLERWSSHYATGFSNSGVTTAVANLDRNPRPEIVLAYRDPSDNRFYSVTGWNLDQTGEPSHWGYTTPLPVSLPTTVQNIDLSIMDLDVFGQTVQRGAGHREKTLVISGLENNPAGTDNFYYSFIRHSNAKDGVFNGNFTSVQKWHRWGPSTNDTAQGALCSVGSNQLANAWDAGAYSTEPISLESGKPYAITFDAWGPAGESNKVMGVKLGSATTNTMIYRQNLSLFLKPGWNRYQVTYNANVNDPNARLEFFFGGSSAPSKVCIDNVRFSSSFSTASDFASFPGNIATNLIKNGTFNYGSMAGWASKSAAYSTAPAFSKIKNGELCHFTPGNTNLEHESIGQNNINLQQGARYRFSYDIRGQYSSPINNAKPKVTIKLGSDGGDLGFENYQTEYEVEVPKEKTSKYFDFTMESASDPVTGLAIFTGNIYPHEVCIDNVSLTKL